jgi:hypothetical protein
MALRGNLSTKMMRLGCLNFARRPDSASKNGASATENPRANNMSKLMGGRSVKDD